MELLTDGSESNPVLVFCQSVIARHAEHWPPTEEALAEEFVNWLGSSSFLGRDTLMKLCRVKGVNLSFSELPPELRGLNCSFEGKREIVITERPTAPFSYSHTLFHEFREMLEHGFMELGHAIVGPEESLEERAEQFPAACRVQEVEKDLPVLIDVVTKIEKKWPRYLAYGLLGILAIGYLFGSVYFSQMEEIYSEMDRQRYVCT